MKQVSFPALEGTTPTDSGISGSSLLGQRETMHLCYLSHSAMVLCCGCPSRRMRSCPLLHKAPAGFSQFIWINSSSSS